MGQPLDLSKVSMDDLLDIHNQVVRQIATVTKSNLGGGPGVAAEPHDSHSSNHSNNKIVADVQRQISQLR